MSYANDYIPETGQSIPVYGEQYGGPEFTSPHGGGRAPLTQLDANGNVIQAFSSLQMPNPGQQQQQFPQGQQQQQFAGQGQQQQFPQGQQPPYPGQGQLNQQQQFPQQQGQQQFPNQMTPQNPAFTGGSHQLSQQQQAQQQQAQQQQAQQQQIQPTFEQLVNQQTQQQGQQNQQQQQGQGPLDLLKGLGQQNQNTSEALMQQLSGNKNSQIQIPGTPGMPQGSAADLINYTKSLKPPVGSAMNAQEVQAFAYDAFSKGVTSEQAQWFLNQQHSIQQQKHNTEMEMRKNETKIGLTALQSMWGDKFGHNVGLLNEAVQQFAKGDNEVYKEKLGMLYRNPSIANQLLQGVLNQSQTPQVSGTQNPQNPPTLPNQNQDEVRYQQIAQEWKKLTNDTNSPIHSMDPNVRGQALQRQNQLEGLLYKMKPGQAIL